MGEFSLQFPDRNKFVLNTLKYIFESTSSFVPLNMIEAIFVDVSIYGRPTGTWSASIKINNAAYPKHRKEEETSPNRNLIITRNP